MRLLIRLFVIGLFVLVALAVGAAVMLDRGARVAVEKGVSYALDVPASVGAVKIHPIDGLVSIEKLSIANPAGFSDKPMLGLDEATLQVQMSSLMGDEVEVTSLLLSGIRLRLEGRGTQTNYGVIQKNLARLGGGNAQPEKPPTEAPAESQGSTKRFIIRDLLIRNTTVEADYALDPALGKLGQGETGATIPEIHLTNLGNGKSLSIAELSSAIFQALLEAAASGKIPGLSADLVKDLAKDLAAHPENAAELGKQVEGALKGVKGLLKRD